jgi:tRNA (guanine37-N1)-methyltransferase
MIEPIDNCINHLKKNNDYSEVIFMTPDAEKLTQKVSNRLSISGNLIILCGHYKGVDQRVRDNLTTMELSIGDFVLSGGELPAAVLCDSIIRLIPGVLNDETSALEDSFQDGIIAPPVYTRPSSYNNLKVPKILLSGNKEKINEWRDKKSDEKTKKMKF